MLQIAIKEFKELLFSPKFLVLSTASFLLIVLAIINGFFTYQADLEAASVAQQKAEKELKEKSSYEHLYPDVARSPEKLAIFDIGSTNSIPTAAHLNPAESRLGSDGKFNNHPILAVFRELDLTFITTTILTLFAILFSYNSVSGEKEDGTLKLMMSNSTRRTSIITGKLIGGFIPLALIFLIPLLLTLTILLFITDISFTGEEWIRISLMAFTYLLCLLAFFTIGLASSAISKNSLFSFILALFFWVVFVGIIPKASVQLATVVNPAMTKGELYEKMSVYWDNNRNSHSKTLQKYLENNPITEDEWKEKSGDVWDKVWKEEEKKEKEFQDKVYAEYDRTKKDMLLTAGFISRFSPASCTSYSAHFIANTGPSLIHNFQEYLEAYSTSFYQWAEAKHQAWKKAGNKYQRRYDKTTTEDGYIKLSASDLPEENLDLTGMPVFQKSPPPLEELVNESITYMATLFFFALLFFAIAYVAFLKYDVR